jgi:tetratricopeptide (TPR) repeat protein
MRIVLGLCIAAWVMFFLATAAPSAATDDQRAPSPDQTKAAQTKAATGEKTAGRSNLLMGLFAGWDEAALKEQIKALDQKQIDRSNALIRRYPKSASGYQIRAGVYENIGDYDKAIADYTEAIRLDPKLKEAYEKRAALYKEHKGDYGKAIADYTEVIRLDPDDMKYFNRAEAYEHKGDHDKAIADYTEAIRLGQKDGLDAGLFYNFRARAYAKKGEHDKAIADCTEAIRLDSLHPVSALFFRVYPLDMYYTRGRAYASKGELDKAIADYTSYIRLELRDADIYAARAAAYEKKGDKAKAEADKAQAKKLRHGNSE